MNLRLVIAIIFAWVALGKCDPNYQLTSSLPKSSTPQAGKLQNRGANYNREHACRSFVKNILNKKSRKLLIFFA
jgi:hypothetical protein